jgi:nicotinamide-nucleotide amidase
VTTPDAHQQLAERVLAEARKRGLKIATAESCTGGMVSAALTDIAGSSDVFERGFVTYSNDAKQEMLGVAAATIAAHGAVSTQTARAMAEGAIRNSRADIAVAITGVAGPGGGSAEKPVGLVCFAIARKDQATLERRQQFNDGGRTAIRQDATRMALEMLLDAATR